MYSHTQYWCFSSGFGKDLPYSYCFFRMSRFDCLTIGEVAQGDKFILSFISGLPLFQDTNTVISALSEFLGYGN